MTDLTGVLTSTGAQLRPGLQHNADAKDELNKARLRADSLRHDAEQSARGVMNAEMHVEQLQARLSAANRRLPSASAADVALGTDRAGSIASESELLEQDIARAEQALRDVQRHADAVNAQLAEAVNAYHALKATMYAEYCEPVEVG